MTGPGGSAPPAAEPSLVDAGGLRIDATPSGPSASVRTQNGRWIRLHSGRDPVAEADRAVADLPDEPAPPLVVIIGVGLGYLLDAIGRRFPSTRVLAVEPLHASAEALRARQTCRDWLASGRLTLLVGPDYDGAGEAWRALNGATDAPIVVSPVLEREFPAEVARAREVVEQVRFGARANAGARREFAPRYLLNTIRNIPRIAASADARALTRAFSGVPAVVVAAGPSLDRALEWLHALPPHVLLIAVDTAARPLLEAGIEPHLVVAVDPSDLNARHLRHLPDTGRTWLVGEGSLDPTAFEWFDGRTFTFAVSDHEPWPWLRSAGLGRGRLRAWGSVLTSALDLALQAGCSPIAFAGADLAYSGGRPYCRGTVYEHDWARRVAGGETLDMIWAQTTMAKARRLADDIYGRPVPTSSALLSFRDWIVEQSTAHPGVRFLNGTGGGVLAGGRIELCTPEDAVAALGANPESQRGTHSPQTVLHEARQRGQAGAAETETRLRAALARVGQATGEDEPRATWQRFAGPDFSADAMARAIDDALAGLAQTHASRPTGPAVLASGAPERVQAIRNAIAPAGPEPWPDDGRHTDVTGLSEARRAHAVLSHSLANLVASPHDLLATGVTGPCVDSVWAPATRAFQWNEGALPAVQAFETALAGVVTRWPAGAGHPLPAVRTAGGHAIPAMPQSRLAGGEIAARLRLAADWLGAAAPASTDARSAPAERGPLPVSVASALLRVGAHALSFAAATPTDAPDAGGVTGVAHLTLGSTTYTAPLTVDDHAQCADALTGALTALSDADGDQTDIVALPSLSFTIPDGVTETGIAVALALHPPVRSRHDPATEIPPPTWVLPLRLTIQAPGCMVGSSVDHAHAVFTLVNGTHSIRIDANGGWTSEPDWPGAIVGEIPWGATGAVAWHNADVSRVLWRERPEGPVHAEPIPFTACLALPQRDGTIWWTSFQGGLWSWAPGGAWQRLVETPPVMGLVSGTDGIYLQPAGADSTFRVRPASTDAFRWSPGASAAEPVALGLNGPCASTSQRKGWTALAYPYEHVVQFAHISGVCCSMVCAQPFNVAWAGDSLVVSSRAELLVFRNLLPVLDASRAELATPILMGNEAAGLPTPSIRTSLTAAAPASWTQAGIPGLDACAGVPHQAAVAGSDPAARRDR